MLLVHTRHHLSGHDTVPLADVMGWARPQLLPVTVIPGGGHFFHGQLPLLKSLVVRHLKSQGQPEYLEEVTAGDPEDDEDGEDDD